MASERILYNKQKGAVRTSRVNSLFDAIPLLAGGSSGNKKADPSKNRLQSNKVPFAGLSSNQILSDVKIVVHVLKHDS
jgi:hypothetical protein